MKHNPVLLKECITGLAMKPNGIYVDGTLGRGSHSAAILKQIPDGHLCAFDRDQSAIVESQERLMAISDRFTLFHTNFAQMKTELVHLGIHQVDGILLDLGVSSPQFDEASRGFSYRFDAPLDMRMDQRQALTAHEIVNTWSYEDLCDILYRYGEERFAKLIVRRIMEVRANQPIETTAQLSELIKEALPQRIVHKKGHPAKKSFQALRIAVNDELHALSIVLQEGLQLLAPQGRFCIISFHSLEDRMVKEAFVKASTPPQMDKRIPILPQNLPQADYRLINKKPITAGADELAANHRSHSAKLRIIERI